MKKIIIRSLWILLALLAVLIIYNRFDARADPDNFTLKDIPATDFNPENGYFLLWALQEPPEADITDPAVTKEYRDLFNPEVNDGKNYLEFAKNIDRYKSKYQPFLKQIRKVEINTLTRPDLSKSSICNEILSKKETLKNLDPLLQVLLNRLQLMIDRPIFTETINVDWVSPIPNLLSWLHTARLYTAVAMLQALDGDWQGGISKLFDLADFGKRAVRGSRALITNLIAKAIIEYPLQGIADLMNRRECPAEAYTQVIERLPELKYEAYGSRQCFIGEAIISADYIALGGYLSEKPFPLRFAASLFLQKNRCRNLIHSIMTRFIAREETPPHLWDTIKEDPIPPFKSGIFWWLRNAAGKMILAKEYDSLEPFKSSNFHAVIFKSYRKKAIYDMLRISAELHLKYDPALPVQKLLSSLDSYKTIDPCSGAPYRWNDEKQLLYSIGTDRTDNNGETLDYTRIEGSDYALPVILYLK